MAVAGAQTYDLNAMFGRASLVASDLNDQPVVVGSDTLIGGYPLTTELDFSRDGAKAGGMGPDGQSMLVLDVSYDDVADEVTIHADSPLITATDLDAVGHGASFSPDNATMVFDGYTLQGKGKTQTLVGRMHTTGTSVAGPSSSLGLGLDGVWGP